MVLESVSEYELGWLAGIIDGEGTIMVAKRGGRSPGYRLIVAVYNNDVKVINTAANIVARLIGDYGSIMSLLRSNSTSTTHRLVLSHAAAGKLLRVITPYLVSKCDRAIIAMMLQDRLESHKSGRPISIEEGEGRDGLYSALKLMNKKGERPA